MILVPGRAVLVMMLAETGRMALALVLAVVENLDNRDGRLTRTQSSGRSRCADCRHQHQRR